MGFCVIFDHPGQIRRMTTPPAPRLIATYRAFRDRPSITSGIIVGVTTAIFLWLIPSQLSWSTRAILAWDAAAGTFLVLITMTMQSCTLDYIHARAAAQDEGQGLTLSLAVLSATASVLAIAIELSLAKNDHGLV